jgi:fructose-bisphosphate aldolase class I
MDGRMMLSSDLVETAQSLVGYGKGILAIDESIGTMDRRLVAAGIAATEDTRRDWRELLISTPELHEDVSGVILVDETIHQPMADGTHFVAALAAHNIIAGIKVDRGARPLALHEHETVTEGLDGLRERLLHYAGLGARFAKWRALFAVGAGLPSVAGIDANAHALARFAALAQEAGLVPIVEPELIMKGDQSLACNQQATDAVLNGVFSALHRQGVVLEAMILKPNMVLPGSIWIGEVTPEEIAVATLDCLLRAVPAAVAGIAFLSGGQAGPLACARLNAINCSQGLDRARTPWPLSFSFGRALQQPAIDIWHGNAANRSAAQTALRHRSRCSHAAIHGHYTAVMEAGSA